MTKIILVTGSPVLDLNTLIGVLDSPAVVVFDADPQVVAEHLVAAGRGDLVPLLDHEDNGVQITYSPVTGERIEVAPVEDDPVIPDNPVVIDESNDLGLIPDPISAPVETPVIVTEDPVISDPPPAEIIDPIIDPVTDIPPVETPVLTDPFPVVDVGVTEPAPVPNEDELQAKEIAELEDIADDLGLKIEVEQK